MTKPSLLVATATAASLVASCSAFSVSSQQQQVLSRSQCSVNVSRGRTAQLSPLFRSKVDPALFMTTGGDDSKDKDTQDAEIVEASASSSTSSAAEVASEGDEKKFDRDNSGLITALVMAPPLIAKFCIVLLVKFLTDVVVYPTLFLFRVGKKLKNKILGRPDDDEEEGLNGINGDGNTGDFA